MPECVEKVVVSLNELNEQYDFFIETLEREELYEFIVEVEEDITEEWREWQGSLYQQDALHLSLECSTLILV
ncbi:hypothetical protein COE15_16830 [Bacillus cereus]|uniref:hypothetical protein n=1 Tax=Bacillus sp. AFS023182 TaxID=2033492 RepID=UPI000BF431F7|nr:hypothetical protein [Bacillus sp. AFS023182]PFE03695.1 hypothetical protein CN288_11950 [Bacillus sp. AFS023182]PGX97804.1 hypothetical protein COE15_16830 [Bacillus cereus]